MLKNLQQMHLNLLLIKVIQKTVEGTGDLIGNKISEKITKVTRTSPQNSSEIVTNERDYNGLDREIPKER